MRLGFYFASPHSLHDGETVPAPLRDAQSEWDG